MSRAGRAALFAGALLVSASTVQAQHVEVRTHFAVGLAEAKQVAYLVTRILRGDEFGITEYFLIMDTDDNRFIARHTTDYMHHVFVREIKDVRRDSFVRSTLELPIFSKNVEDGLAELQANLPKLSGAPFTIEAGGVSITAPKSQWKDEAAANPWRLQLRRAIDPSLLESIEEMRSTLLSGALQTDCMVLAKQFLFEESCSEGDPQARTKEIPFDCDFDASFGMECSENQKKGAVNYAYNTPDE